MQNRTAFVIFTLFLKRGNDGVRTPLYIYERGASLKQGREPMP